jgi:glutamyl-tRNA synthetase
MGRDIDPRPCPGASFGTHMANSPPSERVFRTRFAPSPTGSMHLGHARTHLVAWLLARSNHGRIVMRIEDLDAPRVRPGSEAEILRDHEWLGFDWDEGPFRQSERRDRYEEAVAILRARGAAYPCTCSRKEIEAIASAPHDDEGPIYPGTCRDGATRPDRPSVLRFRMPEPPPEFDDLSFGRSPPGLGRGDFVMRRADGLFAYQLAVVVDDAAMEISHVVRGRDLLASTPKQLAIFDALGALAPRYAHVPLVRGADGERLAKRNGAQPIAAYRAAGVSPERMLGVLARSLRLSDADEISLDELAANFSIEALRAGLEGVTDELIELAPSAQNQASELPGHR